MARTPKNGPLTTRYLIILRICGLNRIATEAKIPPSTCSRIVYQFLYRRGLIVLNIRSLIQTGKAEFLERLTLDRSLFRVQYKDRDMKVIYSKRHKTIVTVLK